MTYPVDIVFPVWNRPVETRACLADLVANSPAARIIMVNYGSERETERILEEFAEALDDRAILVSTERNIGRIAAINHGIALATAAMVVVVHEEVKTSPCWLEPLEEVFERFPNTGLVSPVLGGAWKSSSSALRYIESEYASLGVMAMRRELFCAIGGLDESMDNGVWCLRDYSRRAERAGYRTVVVQSERTRYTEPMLLGSMQKREERVKNGEQQYLENWGERQTFCLAFLGQNTGLKWDELVSTLLTAARQGNTLTLLTDRINFTELCRLGMDNAHAGIKIKVLSRFFTVRGLQKRLAEIAEESPDTRFVNASSIELEGISSITAADFAGIIENLRHRYYTPKGGTGAEKN